jgi:hypothetical protein
VSAAVLILAHAGHLLAALPFVTPCFLLVGGLLVMRAFERGHDDEGDTFREQ